MSITKEFAEAVEEGKLLRVRIMLKDALLVDLSMTMFDEMETYASSRLENLYDEHNKEILNYDHSSWDEDYLNKQMVAVVNNFSRERISFLKDIVRYLYKEKIKQNYSDESSSNNHQYKSIHKTVGTGCTIAGVALTVVGICTDNTNLTIGGVVVGIAGVALLVADKR